MTMIPQRKLNQSYHQTSGMTKVHNEAMRDRPTRDATITAHKRLREWTNTIRAAPEDIANYISIVLGFVIIVLYHMSNKSGIPPSWYESEDENRSTYHYTLSGTLIHLAALF